MEEFPMRIQHNIMAMNAYRNYNNNASALSGNLEKLSSGYKINRAGDDAAGLAISEKMRAQITGLNAAQKNVKDGISLVKTAEGAMQEIQDMLNRMDYLATQSANGTYDESVDRANLQKEVESLRSEIDRIAESANFNGIKLLNGDWQGSTTLASVQAGGGAGGSTSNTTKIGAVTVTKTDGAAGTPTEATKAEFTVDYSGLSGLEANKGYKVGNKEVTITAATGAGLAAALDGQEVTINGTAYVAADAGSGKVKFTAKTAGAVTAESTATNVGVTDGTTNTPTNAGAVTGTPTVSGNKNGEAANPTGTPTAAKTEIDFTGVTGENAAGSTIKIGDKTYEFVNEAGKADAANVEVVVGKTDTADAVRDALKAKVDTDTNVTGTYTVGTDGNKLTLTETAASGTAKAPDVTGKGFKAAGGGGGAAGAGLRLQIGDTNDSYNQLNVEIGEMRTSAMGIDDIDISDQTGAASAIQSIKDAINYVSSVRGDLGAYQNRLDHTLNNLSVMAENIQDAESTIRDTDVADEMMSYVKNNILVQSAQAMLAQANQVPQGVLQLLG